MLAMSPHQLFGGDDHDRTVSLVDELLAGTADEESRVPPGPSLADHDETRVLLAGGLKQNMHRLAVDDKATMNRRVSFECAAPLVFESGGYVTAVPGRWN